MLNFFRVHSNLEQLSIHYIYDVYEVDDDLQVPMVNFYVPNVNFQLLKLKRLFCHYPRVLKGNDKFIKRYEAFTFN